MCFISVPGEEAVPLAAPRLPLRRSPHLSEGRTCAFLGLQKYLEEQRYESASTESTRQGLQHQGSLSDFSNLLWADAEAFTQEKGR